MATEELVGRSHGEQPIFSLENVTPIKRLGRDAKFSTAITVGRVGELLKSDYIRVDYDYQRGMRPLYKADGTMDESPMLDKSRVNEIATKILDGRLYGGSLTWSLRKGEVDFRYDPRSRSLHVYKGQPTIPDSNHRHQAMLKVFELVKSRGYNFDFDDYEFPLLIEVLDLNEESELFYEYNQLGKPANPTRSRWINQADLYSALTSQVVALSKLKGYVELVTNNISKNSPKVVTFNALYTAVKAGFPELDDSNVDVIQPYLVSFVDELVMVRPETGHMPLSQRKIFRDNGIGDSALAFYGYGMLAGDLMEVESWRNRLADLREPYACINKDGKPWAGDLMSRENPIWEGKALLRGAGGKLQISNNRETRQFMHETLRGAVGL